MRVLLFGGSGQLGSEIVARWRDDTIVAPSSAEANIEDDLAVSRAIALHDPEVIINCTAFHNVDECQRVPERAFEVNAYAVEQLADANAVFVTFSTDYVFDGDTDRPYVETDAPHPLSQYGASKLEGERRVAALDMRAFVVRTCGLYGTRVSSSKGYTFVDRVITMARAGERQRIVNDSFASPTYAAHLATAVRALIDTQRYGLYHGAAAGVVSWYDFATAALAGAGVPGEIEAIGRESWIPATPRPRYSALASERLADLGIVMPPWSEGLRDYLRDKL